MNKFTTGNVKFTGIITGRRIYVMDLQPVATVKCE